MYYRTLRKHSGNLYVCSPYGLTRDGLTEVENFYISIRIKSDKFKIYEVIELENGKKYVYLRELKSNKVYRIVIPKVKKIYEKKNFYCWKRVYYWKTKKGILKKYTSYVLYNRNAHRYYRLNDVNKYGHVLKKITEEALFEDTRDVLKYVGLNVSV